MDLCTASTLVQLFKNILHKPPGLYGKMNRINSANGRRSPAGRARNEKLPRKARLEVERSRPYSRPFIYCGNTEGELCEMLHCPVCADKPKHEWVERGQMPCDSVLLAACAWTCSCGPAWMRERQKGIMVKMGLSRPVQFQASTATTRTAPGGQFQRRPWLVVMPP